MTPTNLVIFGATGDLARQKLFPTLYGMFLHGSLPEHITIWALGRRAYDDAEFIEHIRQNLEKHGEYSQESLRSFAVKVRYQRLDFDQPQDYHALVSSYPANRLFYLAVAPESFPVILQNLKRAGLTDEVESAWTRLVVEKPFGHDLASAQELAGDLAKALKESQVYRLDHYLGKETIQNILAFRFANGIFEQSWNNQHIDHIQITVAEEEGIGTRAAYYDQTGAFRDLVQNHILQLLCVLTMEEPGEFSYDALSDRTLAVLKSLAADPNQTVFGQYHDYLGEANVPPESRTETYAMTSFEIDSPRWQGVPIYVRTGKGLAKKVSEVSVQFKQPSQNLFFPDQDLPPSPNILTFRIQPDEGISLNLMVKTPRHNMEIQPVTMEFCYKSAFESDLPDAYERLLSDILFNDRTLSLREDVIEESWRVTDKLLGQSDQFAFQNYRRGSWGPERADELLAEQGRRWLARESTACNAIITNH